MSHEKAVDVEDRRRPRRRGGRRRRHPRYAGTKPDSFTVGSSATIKAPPDRIYEWDGNKDVGKGRMEIGDTMVPTKIIIKLDFIEPFEGHNTAEFTMVPVGDSTTVTWATYGSSPDVVKVMGTFFNMYRMIGDDFQAGFANLETVAEK